MPNPQSEQVPELSVVQKEEMRKAYHQAQIADAANWFYIIAGLSVLNLILIVVNSPIVMAIGLSSAEFAMYMFHGIIGIVLGLVISGFFGVMGLFATQGAKWAFILGMLLYLGDGILTLMGKQYIGVAIHGYALYCLFNGLKLCFEEA